ncbi:hypothetical protein ACWJJH_22515 [Endozoicomonadaceae bacterium StTr2]
MQKYFYILLLFIPVFSYAHLVQVTFIIEGVKYELETELDAKEAYLFCSVCRNLVSEIAANCSECSKNICLDEARIFVNEKKKFNKNDFCPNCSTPGSTLSRINLKTQVNGVTWHCPFMACKFTGNLSEVKAHIVKCPDSGAQLKAGCFSKPVSKEFCVDDECRSSLHQKSVDTRDMVDTGDIDIPALTIDEDPVIVETFPYPETAMRRLQQPRSLPVIVENLPSPETLMADIQTSDRLEIERAIENPTPDTIQPLLTISEPFLSVYMLGELIGRSLVHDSSNCWMIDNLPVNPLKIQSRPWLAGLDDPRQCFIVRNVQAGMESFPMGYFLCQKIKRRRSLYQGFMIRVSFNVYSNKVSTLEFGFVDQKAFQLTQYSISDVTVASGEYETKRMAWTYVERNVFMPKHMSNSIYFYPVCHLYNQHLSEAGDILIFSNFNVIPVEIIQDVQDEG